MIHGIRTRKSFPLHISINNAVVSQQKITFEVNVPTNKPIEYMNIPRTHVHRAYKAKYTDF